MNVRKFSSGRLLRTTIVNGDPTPSEEIVVLPQKNQARMFHADRLKASGVSKNVLSVINHHVLYAGQIK